MSPKTTGDVSQKQKVTCAKVNWEDDSTPKLKYKKPNDAYLFVTSLYLRKPKCHHILPTASPACWESRNGAGGRKVGGGGGYGGVLVAISCAAQTPRRSPFINYLISD